MKGVLALLALAAVHTSAFADNAPIVADRPGFSTGTYTVKPGKLNVEFGYKYAFKFEGDRAYGAHLLTWQAE